MAISFIPIRDQARVITGAKESNENKGEVLKRISTGKKVAEPRDNISDYRKISSMKSDLVIYADAIKNVSLHTSRLETSLAVNKLLEDQYGILIEKLRMIDTYKNSLSGTTYKAIDDAETASPGTGATVGAGTAINKVDKLYYESDINGTIDAINNAMNTLFNYEQVAKDYGLDTTATGGEAIKEDKVQFAFTGYNDVEVTLGKFEQIYRVYDVNGDKYEADPPASPPNRNIFDNVVLFGDKSNDSDFTKRMEISDLVDKMQANKTVAQNNYKLILAGITNLASIDDLAKVQKTNSDAAISALEDIDVQEEMIVLMQAQILEELSSEALVKIKESSRYVVNLIRA